MTDAAYYKRNWPAAAQTFLCSDSGFSATNKCQAITGQSFRSRIGCSKVYAGA